MSAKFFGPSENRCDHNKQMWTNISATTKVAADRVTPNQSQVGAYEVKLESEIQLNNCNKLKNDAVLNPIDVESSRNCGSPLMRYKHAVCSAQDGFIYIHGGRFGNLPLDDDIWRFDPHQNSWLRLNTFGQRPPSLQEHTLVEYEQHLYLFGGQVSTPGAENSFWRLDLTNNEWQSLDLKSTKKFGAYLGPTNRRGHSAVIYGTSMYIFGGFEDFRGSSGQLWEYEFAGRRWLLRNLSSTSACQPEPRHSHSAVVHGHSMYVYGGLSDLKSLGDLWRWSWQDKRWFKERTRGKSPGQLHGHAAIQAFGSMFVFGGERADGRPTRGLWRLNLSNLTWQKIRPKGPRPNPTTWHAAIANPLHILDEANYIVEGNQELALLPKGSSSSTSIHLSNATSTDMRPVRVEDPKSQSTSSQVATVSTTKPKSTGRNKRSRLSFLQHKRRSKSQTSGLSQVRYSNSTSAGLNGLVNQEAQTSVQTKTKTNSNILDNLDSDIKEMFQHVLNPVDDPSESENADMATTSIETANKLSPIPMSQYETAISLDESTLISQQTSLGAYATPPSEMVNSQTSNIIRPARLDRPKSEIVQSLIERADARIKHLYTPFFNNQQPTGVQNRHQKEAKMRLSQQPTRNPSTRSERFSLDAKNKRHTIHQTMTYYNLYFSEDKTSSNSPPSSSDNSTQAPMESDHNDRKQEAQDEMNFKSEMTRDDLSYTSTIKGGSAGTLVGVRGANLATVDADLAQDQISYADSRTLCGDTPEANRRLDLIGALSPTPTTETVASIGSALTSREQTDAEVAMNVEGDAISPGRAGSAGDDTSLSFSVIAEYEEDDMLQYSSPTEPVLARLESNRQTVIFAPSSSRRAMQESDKDTRIEQRLDGSISHKSVSGSYEESISARQQSKSSSSLAKSPSTTRREMKETSRQVVDESQENSSLRTDSDLGFNSADTASPERQSAVLKRMKARSGIVGEISRSSETKNQVYTATTSSSLTADSLLMPSDGSIKTDTSLPQMEDTHQQRVPAALSINDQGVVSPGSVSIMQRLFSPDQHSRSTATGNESAQFCRARFFGKSKSKTRYWQLCMFVIGGKQNGIHGLNEPITVWRLYI